MALTGLKTATLLAGLAGAFAAPGVAQAQFFFDTWGGRFSAPLDSEDYGRDYDRPYREYDRPYREAAPISRGQIASILSRRGYRVNPAIARNNDVYLVDAIDPAGRRLRLVVDAYDATILRRLEAGPPRSPATGAVTRRENDESWMEDDEFGPPPGAPPRVIPGVGPAQRKPAPKKPATARVEPRAPAQKPATTPPAAGPATPPATAPAPATPGPAAAAPPRKPSQDVRAQAPAAAEPTPEPAAPRVIPLYKTPTEDSAEKPAEGPP